MVSSTAKMLAAHAGHVTAAKAADVASAEATDVPPTKTADMASTKGAHVATTKTAAHVSSATATAGLRISGKKAAGKQGSCQNHHHSSSHDILLFGIGGTFRHRIASDGGACQRQRPPSR
jgi:uncharacterized protein (DUF2342 family)